MPKVTLTGTTSCIETILVMLYKPFSIYVLSNIKKKQFKPVFSKIHVERNKLFNFIILVSIKMNVCIRSVGQFMYLE